MTIKIKKIRMITFQENTHFSQALPCSREEFWEQVRKTSTRWRVDARRAILAAVEAAKTEGTAAIQTWLNNGEYQKFLLKKQGLKKKAAKEAWAKKTDAEKLLAFAQEVKENLPAFIFGCREFDEKETAKSGMFRHRRLADCHLNGLFMLDIDHIENPMEVWYRLREDKELMERIALVHITSSSYGIRIVATADVETGNLADNQIVLAQALGYKADDSCIDATRNSFAPKEEDIIYMNEELLFDYYNEEFDKRYTQLYREKKTQPLYHEFAADDEKNTNHMDKKTNTNLTNPTNNGEQDDLVFKVLLMLGIVTSCPAQRTPTGIMSHSNSPQTYSSCSTGISRKCCRSSRHKVGCRRSSQSAMRMSNRRWSQQQGASRRRRRSMQVRCHPKPCRRR